ncbi:MAG: amidohydrolase family protein, partial [Bacteroidota bacterium]
MKKILLIITGIVVAAAVFMNLVLQKQQADLLIINGNVYTVDAANSKAEAIAVRGSRIVAVGTTQDIQKQYTSQNVIDVEGKTVIPGLIDGHAHMLGLGEALTELNLVGTASAEAIASMVAEKARKLPPGEWIRGGGWDQNDWGSGTGEKPFPTSAVLDKAAPNNPVILSRIDGHAIWVNS